jgi:hypothetical protein
LIITVLGATFTTNNKGKHIIIKEENEFLKNKASLDINAIINKCLSLVSVVNITIQFGLMPRVMNALCGMFCLTWIDRMPTPPSEQSC